MPVDPSERQRLFELYLASRAEQIEWVNRQSTHFEHFLTLVLALLAITLGAAYHFLVNRTGIPWAWWAIGAVSALNAIAAIAGAKACDRSYQRFLEEVTISAKLDGFFGWDEQRPSASEPQGNQGENQQGSLTPFRDDGRLLPDRWVEDRAKYLTATEFRKAKMKAGVNLWVRITWISLWAINSIVAIGAVLVAVGLVPIPRA